MKAISRLALVAALTVGLASCTSADSAREQTAAAPSAPQTVGRIIVKPRKPVADGETLMKQIGERLASTERVSFLRAMSGNAFVLNVISPATAADIPRIIAELVATELFEYVEADQQLTIKAK